MCIYIYRYILLDKPSTGAKRCLVHPQRGGGGGVLVFGATPKLGPSIVSPN